MRQPLDANRPFTAVDHFAVRRGRFQWMAGPSGRAGAGVWRFEVQDLRERRGGGLRLARKNQCGARQDW